MCSPGPNPRQRRWKKINSSSPERLIVTTTAITRNPMPTANAKDGCPINYEVEVPAAAPVLMLCNSLGTNLHMWDDQAAAWSKQFRLVRYDRRGHGKSGAPKGPYSMDML